MHNAVGVLAGKPLGALAAAMTAVLVITGCSPAARRHTARLTVRPVTSTAEHWGSLFGGGPGYFGQAASPAAVTLPGTVAEVGSSNSTEYALLTNGALYAWGLNTAGPLGDGHHRQSDVPVRVRLPGPVTRAAQGGSYWNNGQSLVLLSNGSVWAWGDGKRGQLGRRAARSRRSRDGSAFPPG